MKALLMALVGLIAPGAAFACGGLFCETPTKDTVAKPVQQERERILFEVHPDGTLTVVVEIGYVGSPDGFAWVLPVPETPTLGTAPSLALQALDRATSPMLTGSSVVYPSRTATDGRFGPDSWGGGGGGGDAGGDDDDDDDAWGDDDGGGKVVVEKLEQVGPYDPTVISSDDAGAVAEWLRANGYLLTPEMEPFIAAYVSQGMKFLGLRLAPEGSVQDIAPISMTYAGTEPSIPLRLTGVAAAPEMNILVLVIAGERFGPKNWANVDPPAALLQVDPRTYANNYYSLLSYLADLEGGRAFFTEFADYSYGLFFRDSDLRRIEDDGGESALWLENLLAGDAFITRMFTRVSMNELVTDPIFGPLGYSYVSQFVNVGGEVCWDFDHSPRPACADTYCGVGGACGETADGRPGCRCDEGYVPRRISAPQLGIRADSPSVTCEDASVDLLGSAGGGSPTSPCTGWSCGDFGECVVHAGFPTCRCVDGFIAVPTTADFLTCEPAAETFAPEQVLWPNWPPTVDGCPFIDGALWTGRDHDDVDVNADADPTASDDIGPSACGVAGRADALAVALLAFVIRRRRSAV